MRVGSAAGLMPAELALALPRQYPELLTTVRREATGGTGTGYTHLGIIGKAPRQGTEA